MFSTKHPQRCLGKACHVRNFVIFSCECKLASLDCFEHVFVPLLALEPRKVTNVSPTAASCLQSRQKLRRSRIVLVYLHNADA